MNGTTTLAQHLARMDGEHGCAPQPMQQLLGQVASACQAISAQVRAGALAGVLGAAGSENVQGEAQQKLDVLANETFMARCHWGGRLAGMASEEMPAPYPIPASEARGDYLLLFDPLDGSSNIDVNVSIGTIFSVLRMPQGRSGASASEADFLQPGRQQLAAGYCIYGPQTTLVLTLGHGVAVYTLDPQAGTFILTREQLQIPRQTAEFAINMSNMRHWAAPVRRYVDECLAGSQGPRGKDFNMRWVASMVADVHRILCRGGIFMYPWDAREPKRPGKLRLLYEASPMAWIVEQAGGAASNGEQRILDVVPAQLHERVSVILGSHDEVTRVASYHAQDKPAR